MSGHLENNSHQTLKMKKKLSLKLLCVGVFSCLFCCFLSVAIAMPFNLHRKQRQKNIHSSFVPQLLLLLPDLICVGVN